MQLILRLALLFVSPRGAVPSESVVVLFGCWRTGWKVGSRLHLLNCNIRPAHPRSEARRVEWASGLERWSQCRRSPSFPFCSTQCEWLCEACREPVFFSEATLSSQAMSTGQSVWPLLTVREQTRADTENLLHRHGYRALRCVPAPLPRTHVLHQPHQPRPDPTPGQTLVSVVWLDSVRLLCLVVSVLMHHDWSCGWFQTVTVIIFSTFSRTKCDRTRARRWSITHTHSMCVRYCLTRSASHLTSHPSISLRVGTSYS